MLVSTFCKAFMAFLKFACFSHMQCCYSLHVNAWTASINVLALHPLLQKHWFVPVGKPLLSRFPNRERQSGTKGVPFCPGSGNRDKRSLFFMFFFSQFFFYFNYTFAFQLNLCIGIQCVWSPLIYTHIYIYIVTYIIFVLDSFHI